MAKITVPKYERQVEAPQQNASQAKAPEPLRQAYGENVAQAVGEFGRAMTQLGDDLIKLDAQINKDNLVLQTSKMNDNFKVFYAEMKNRDDFYNFDKDTDKEIETQLKQLKASLGNDTLFDKWYAIEGKAYVDSLRTQTQILKLPAQYKYNVNNLAQLGEQLSYDYATGDDTAKVTFEEAVDSNAVLKKADKDNLIFNFNKSYAKNELESIIDDHPQQVIDNINSKKYTFEIDGDKWDALSPKEEAYYLRRAKNIQDAKSKTILAESLEGFNDWWNSMNIFEKNQKYKEIVADKEKTGRSMLDDMFPEIKGKKQDSIINYMGSCINDSANGFNAMGDYIVQDCEQQYDQVFDSKGNIKKDIPFTEAIALYSNLSAIAKNQSLNLSPEKEEKINKRRNLTLTNIGNGVLSNTIQTPSYFQTSGGKKTNNFEMTKNAFREVLEKDGFINYFGAIEGASLTPADVGTMFVDVFLTLEEEGLNPASLPANVDPNIRTNKRRAEKAKKEMTTPELVDNKGAIMNVVAKTVRDYFAKKMGWSLEQANAFLVNKKIINYQQTANKDNADLILEGF